jgi:hypothetical protein
MHLTVRPLPLFSSTSCVRRAVGKRRCQRQSQIYQTSHVATGCSDVWEETATCAWTTQETPRTPLREWGPRRETTYVNPVCTIQIVTPGGLAFRQEGAECGARISK